MPAWKTLRDKKIERIMTLAEKCYDNNEWLTLHPVTIIAICTAAKRYLATNKYGNTMDYKMRDRK